MLLLYYITPRKFRNLLLFAVNLIFYGWGEPRFILLMLLSIAVNYASGLLIGNFKNPQKQNLKAAKAVLVTSITVNVGLLVFFKYAGFIGNTLNIVLPFVNIPVMKIPLPVGISFYTFQTMSYVIDVYRNDAKAQKSFITFGTYVSLFPQLIAGPIVRYRDVETQLISRRESINQFNNGVKLFVIGLCKKVLLANQMGELWDILRENFTSGGTLSAWFGICAYSLQIYFDFCGYSEMAMGLGNMLGFDFLKNFDYPYISKSITEFWRRWHISLSGWFKEYIYIPLGGNRKGFKRQIFNMLVVWALTGLWHGANYNFILWGLYFFAILFLEKLFMLKALEKLPSVFCHIYSLLLIVLGWLIFYFEDMSQLWNYLCVMFGSSGVFVSEKALTDIISYLPIFAVAVFACTPVSKSLYNKIPKNNLCFTLETVGCMCGLVLSTASLASSGYNPFLYFRF